MGVAETMIIMQNSDPDYVREMKNKIKENDGYCPCKVDRTEDTKCMCKEFRDMISNKETGSCHCGLFFVINEVEE